MNRAVALLMFTMAPAAANAAGASNVHTADRDGSRFEYTAKLAANGRVIIDGRFLKPANEAFALEVAPTGLVTGVIDGNSVQFSVGAGGSDRLIAELRGNAPAVVAQAN